MARRVEQYDPPMPRAPMPEAKPDDRDPDVFDDVSPSPALIGVSMFALMGDVAEIRAYRAHARDHRDNAALLYSVISDEFQDGHLAVIDELLADFPGITPGYDGPKALKRAAHAGNLAVMSHLFPRFGESSAWSLYDRAVMPTESKTYLEAFELGLGLPLAMAPAPSMRRRL
jgi:hypothetical protein